jgi:hypothetical protein
MTARKIATLLVTLLLLAACSSRAMIDRFAPHPQTERARAMIDTVRRGDLPAIRALLNDAMQSEVTDAQLQKIAAAFPAGDPASVTLVGAYTTYLSEGGHRTAHYSLTFQYAWPPRWLLVNVVLTGDDPSQLAGIHLNVLDRPLEQINAFTLHDKNTLQFGVLALAILVPLFCLSAFVRCLRTPMRRRKWLWATATLLGVTTLQINWSTGAWGVQLLSVQLFGASAMASPFGPWVIGVSFPLGAVWFLLRRRQLMVEPAAAQPLPRDDAEPS